MAEKKKLEEVHVGADWVVSPTGKDVCITRPDGEVITVSHGIYVPTREGEHVAVAGNGKAVKVMAVCPPQRGDNDATTDIG